LEPNRSLAPPRNSAPVKDTSASDFGSDAAADRAKVRQTKVFRNEVAIFIRCLKSDPDMGILCLSIPPTSLRRRLQDAAARLLGWSMQIRTGLARLDTRGRAARCQFQSLSGIIRKDTSK